MGVGFNAWFIHLNRVYFGNHSAFLANTSLLELDKI